MELLSVAETRIAAGGVGGGGGGGGGVAEGGEVGGEN